jgi:dienelactone hydrolase
VDGLLGLSQVPGVPQLKPLVPGAPGHGEGHNSGMPLMIAAALATKEVMIKHNLKGKLMLAHGTMDDNVPPDNTWLVVDALIKAGKDFDLVMIPNALHGYGAASNYMMRRRWDYFVQHLLGATPPKEYQIGPKS